METDNQAPVPPLGFDGAAQKPGTVPEVAHTSQPANPAANVNASAPTQPASASSPTKPPGWLIALKVALTVLILLAQPQFLWMGLMSVETHGFLGGWLFLITPPVMVGLLTTFIWFVPNKKVCIASASALVLCAALLVGNHLWATRNIIDEANYNEPLASELLQKTSEAGIDYEDYRPFASANIARLGEESTLRFGATETLPRIDSATALLPLASSVVSATYPESATTICFDNEDYSGPGIFYYAGQSEDDFVLYTEDFQFNNSTWGFRYLARGGTDLFLGTKAPSEDVAFAQARGVTFNYTPIGREGFVFIVNENNPVDSLTVQQVKDIYSGKITNWKEVGGNDEPIMAYQHNTNSGSQSTMEAFMGDTPLMAPPSTLNSSSMSGMVKSIADYDNGSGAIGYSFRYYVTDLVKDNDVKILKIDGVEPSIENLRSSTYPATYDFYAVTREGDVSENTQRLIDWILGPQGQELVEKSGYASVG